MKHLAHIVLTLTLLLLIGSVFPALADNPQRTVRTAVTPERDDELVLEPGESMQITKVHDLDLDADRVEILVTGNDAQYISVRLDDLIQNERLITVTFTLSLSPDAPREQRLFATLIFRYFEGENSVDKPEDYFIDVPEMPPLTAHFEADVTTGDPQLRVRFSDRSRGNIENWFWTFGDGSNSREQNPVHVYVEPGHYEVNLTVTGGDGEQNAFRRPNYIWVMDPNEVLLRYENPDRIPKFLTIPSYLGFQNDTYYNVRFTPPFFPFRVVEAQIGLFSLDSLPDGDMGAPGMRVIVWQSGDFDGSPGFPVEALDSVDVAYGDLEFGGADPIWNIVNLDPLRINFYGMVDFHIGVDLIRQDEQDTLAIYTDDGRYRELSRSYFWNGEYEEWMIINNGDGGFDRPYNLAIRAVVEFQNGVRAVLDPNDLTPHAILIDPAYPNPFNPKTKVNFRVAAGQTWVASLIDLNGRTIRSLDQGIGNGVSQLSIDLSGQPAGKYFLRIETPTARNNTPLLFVK